MAARTRRWRFAMLALGSAVALAACGGGGGGGGGGDGGAVTATPGKGKITIEWSHSSAESYTLEFSNSSGSEASAPRQIEISGMISGVTSPYEHDYLIYGETYTYTVYALDSSGNSSTVGSDGATPDRLPLDEIEFADSNTEQCVAPSIEPGGENEGADFADEIDTLTVDGEGETDMPGCISSQIEDLSGLEWLTSVTALDVSINGIGDVSPLSTMLLMEALNLSYNQITTGVSGLLGLKNLSSLDISNNSSYLPCADLQTLLDEFTADVVDPDDTGVGNCFSGT